MDTPSEICSHPGLLPEGYRKQGIGASVENTVSDIVASPDRMDEYFAGLSEGIDAAVRGSSTTAQLRRVRLKRQASEGVASYAIMQEAMPPMTAWHREHGSLIPSHSVVHNPDPDSYDARAGLVSEYTPLYVKALSANHWFCMAAERFLNESQADRNHPYHKLHRHLDENWEQYREVYTAYLLEHNGSVPQKHKDWMASHTYKDIVTFPNEANDSIELNLLAASTVHYLVHNENPTVQGLATAVLRRIPQMRWMATLDKNSGIQKARNAGLISYLIPLGAAHLLTKQLVEASNMQELTEPFMRYRVIADPDFYPADILRNGPLSKTSTCTGDLEVRMPNNIHRRNAIEFFTEMGLPRLGHLATLSTIAVRIGAGKRQAETTFLPEFMTFMRRHGQLRRDA